MKRYYAGIGSRKTPTHVLGLMTFASAFLESQDYILRSGAADGADLAFEKGVADPSAKEIFLPWRGFNGSTSNLYLPRSEAYLMAEEYHPAWDSLSSPGRSLMARNCHQVLGLDLNTPVDMILCWTEGGKKKGGTAQALRLAADRGILIINLFFDKNKVLLSRWVEEGVIFFP